MTDWGTSMVGKLLRGAFSLDDQNIVVRQMHVLTCGRLTQHCGNRQSRRSISELGIPTDRTYLTEMAVDAGQETYRKKIWPFANYPSWVIL